MSDQIKEIETRMWRVGIAPLFAIAFTLSRSDLGVHAGVNIHIFKCGLHFSLSVID